ncbi:GSU3473 family protein [Trichloromonas sp.]|uniref:GSU3473 family protein n=1 Tax=Trichloromonas sp. TaxID=3069249 RepID=UPI003D8176C2
MMIRVEYPDGTHQLVRPYVLSQLIAKQAITRFERSGGWAVLGEARLRSAGGSFHSGKNRRASA